MKKNLTIGVRLEGGLGDHLLANRFVHAIIDKYEKAELTFYSDTEGNDSQINFLKKLWNNIYKENNCFVIPNRKSKEFKIESQFGKEIYNAHINNTPEEYLNQYNKYDLFYNLCIDNLDWLQHDYDWVRWYYHFPKPYNNSFKNSYKEKLPENFICAHLYARPNSPYNLEITYVNKVIESLSKNYPIVIITTKDCIDYYSSFVNNNKNIFLTTPDLIECCDIISKCNLFLGIDSGIRYIPYHFSKPTFVFSKYCSNYGNVAPSHLLRWLIFEKNVFPINFNIDVLCKIIYNTFEKKYNYLFPYIDSIDIDNYIIKRNI